MLALGAEPLSHRERGRPSGARDFDISARHRWDPSIFNVPKSSVEGAFTQFLRRPAISRDPPRAPRSSPNEAIRASYSTIVARLCSRAASRPSLSSISTLTPIIARITRSGRFFRNIELCVSGRAAAGAIRKTSVGIAELLLDAPHRSAGTGRAAPSMTICVPVMSFAKSEHSYITTFATSSGVA